MSGLSTFLFSFRGRLSRLQWWLFTLFTSIPASLCDKTWDGVDDAPWLAVLALIAFTVAVAWAWMAVSIKRLHDIDKSGWWLLLIFIPFLGALALLILHGFVRGTPWLNRYDPPKSDRALASVP